MRYIRVMVITLAVLSGIVLWGGCGKSNSTDDVPIYSYQDIPYPTPEVFKVVYNISTYGDKEAIIQLDTNGVWLIEKLGDGRINFFVLNDTGYMDILSADTLGLKAGYPYRFMANNNNYDEFTNFFTQFTRLPLDYHTFEPKF